MEFTPNDPRVDSKLQSARVFASLVFSQLPRCAVRKTIVTSRHNIAPGCLQAHRVSGSSQGGVWGGGGGGAGVAYVQDGATLEQCRAVCLSAGTPTKPGQGAGCTHQYVDALPSTGFTCVTAG
jgi:hypothetical protein